MVEKPTAILFRNGSAAFCDEDGRQIAELQRHGWRGMHEFIERYPDSSIYIQGASPLEPDMLTSLLTNIASP